MKKLLIGFAVIFSLLTTTSIVFAQNSNFCPDNKTPVAYDQPLGTSYRGGDGTIFKCELVNGVASWVSQSATIFSFPNFGGFFNLGNLFDALISLAFFAVGIAFFFNLIIGGFQWINAGGDPKAMTSARARITNALIGLVIVVGAYALTSIIGAVLGISIVGGFHFHTP